MPTGLRSINLCTRLGYRSAYAVAIYPPMECPANVILDRLCCTRHDSSDSTKNDSAFLVVVVVVVESTFDNDDDEEERRSSEDGEEDDTKSNFGRELNPQPSISNA